MDLESQVAHGFRMLQRLEYARRHCPRQHLAAYAGGGQAKQFLGRGSGSKTRVRLAAALQFAFGPLQLFAKPHDFADHQRRRSFDAVQLRLFGDRLQGPADHLFAVPERHLDDGRRGAGMAAFGDQTFGNLPDRMHAHQKNQRRNLAQCVEIDIVAVAAAKMAGHNRHGGSRVAVRHRNSRAERRRERRGNARNHVEADAVFSQIFGLFSAAAEQERIAALQPNHHLALARFVDKQFVDLILARIVTADRLAHVNALGGRLRQRQYVLLNQPVVNNDIGRLDQVRRLDRQQLRMPGAGPNQIDFSRSSHFISHDFTQSLPLRFRY